jgi:hypothetical protein
VCAAAGRRWRLHRLTQSPGLRPSPSSQYLFFVTRGSEFTRPAGPWHPVVVQGAAALFANSGKHCPPRPRAASGFVDEHLMIERLEEAIAAFRCLGSRPLAPFRDAIERRQEVASERDLGPDHDGRACDGWSCRRAAGPKKAIIAVAASLRPPLVTSGLRHLLPRSGGNHIVGRKLCRVAAKLANRIRTLGFQRSGTPPGEAHVTTSIALASPRRLG